MCHAYFTTRETGCHAHFSGQDRPQNMCHAYFITRETGCHAQFQDRIGPQIYVTHILPPVKRDVILTYTFFL